MISKEQLLARALMVPFHFPPVNLWSLGTYIPEKRCILKCNGCNKLQKCLSCGRTFDEIAEAGRRARKLKDSLTKPTTTDNIHPSVERLLKSR